MSGPTDDPIGYRQWVAQYDSPSAAELARIPPMSGPRISIAMAVGDTTAEAATQTAASLCRQIYTGWELLLSHRLFSSWPRETLAELAAADPRIRLLDVPSAGGLLNTALAARSGLLVCILDPGDLLPPTALYEVVAAFAAHPDTQLLYSDEDSCDDGGRRDPHFKPDFSPDPLLAGNSIGQLAVYRAELLDRLGDVRTDLEPFSLYDLVLRTCAVAAPGSILHLPAVLCHRATRWADWPAPAATPPRTAPGLLAIADARWPRPRFALPEPVPLVSVIVPTRDQPELLGACVAGLLERTDYPAIELLVVDNGSQDPAALETLSRLAALPGVRVLSRPGPFNFAALNNATAAEATGDVLLLLNDDTEMLHADWLRELVSHAVRPDVGAVGARLLYPDGTLQHGGILLGPGGAATHVGRGAQRESAGYDGQLAVVRDLSAVTGACLAIRREVFHAVGGMDERLAVTWNDVDLCLRVRAAGLRVVWTPYAVLRHREGSTRGTEASDPAKLARFLREQALMRDIWGNAMEVDPFLNPNLLASEDGALVPTRPRVRRPWH